jgi:glycosyltransferase involved in cell wall biosynthesis
VGSGPDESMLRELADQLGLAGVVRFHGHVSDREKYALLQQARLHVSASDIEGWGQVVIEAASVGVPTLARDVPGLRESIRSGQTGWLVDEPDSDLRGVAARLVTHIEQALVELEDDSRRTTIRRACRTWATQFTWSEMHRQLRTIAAEELGCTSEEQPRYEGLAS